MQSQISSCLYFAKSIEIVMSNSSDEVVLQHESLKPISIINKSSVILSGICGWSKKRCLNISEHVN